MVAIWNSAAIDVWAELQTGKSTSAIATKLAPRWGVSLDNAAISIDEFITELTLDGFLLNDREPTGSIIEDDDNSGEETLLAIEMIAIESLTPYSVTFETTYACNESCVHCYMDRGKRSLSFSKIIEILDQLADAGTLFISFTGGEFFTRSDALEVIDAAHKRGFVIDILSNGTLIDEEIAAFLGCRRVRRVQLSIYGCREIKHMME